LKVSTEKTTNEPFSFLIFKLKLLCFF